MIIVKNVTGNVWDLLSSGMARVLGRVTTMVGQELYFEELA